MIKKTLYELKSTIQSLIIFLLVIIILIVLNNGYLFSTDTMSEIKTIDKIDLEKDKLDL
ncbi:MAG: hypothetical protein U9Q30_08410 [Campylobacterota bacterium]|nr:hypothetical protein [Campylobacterota bacterium]